MYRFELTNNFTPRGDQPKAIEKLVEGYNKFKNQTLLGVTGSGKTYTVANVIRTINKPTLVISPNKTLASQLYQEFTEFFPKNKVCYFVSYYDYYQPESYLPPTDTYIEKDILVNEKIEQLRMEAATALMSRTDVIVVASVSCIYGLGQPADFEKKSLQIKKGMKLSRQDFIRQLISMRYERNDIELRAGTFRAKGDTIDVLPVSANSNIIRVEFFGDEIDAISELQFISQSLISETDEIWIYPASPFVVSEDNIPQALESIRKELAERLPQLGTIESYRLNQRTNYDMEMIEQLGYCKGIENYSRHFDQRKPGTPPLTLLDFFNYSYDDDWLMVLDESHQVIPQVNGMYNGDYARKKNLIDYGFRLPSAFDNRPLKFEEFKNYMHHVIYTSATPGEYEFNTSGQVIEQIIRPTGLLDPFIEIRPSDNQVPDLIQEITKITNRGWRTLVTTLTKRMAEDLSHYLEEKGIKAVYLHSEIDTLERVQIIRELRQGKYDVLVGINLLREGLDIPEVALVAILDADTEGFLRNTRSLIQTIGRAARNAESKVIMYANKETGSIKQAVEETSRRRTIQMAYNKEHGITPQTIVKNIIEEQEVIFEPGEKGKELELDTLIVDLEGQMQAAAESLDFEKAIELRDKLEKLKKKIKEQE